MKTIEEVMAQLSPDLQQEVWDFAQFLVEKRTVPKCKKLRLDWAGGLSEFCDQYSSLELQKKSLEWWGD